MSGPFVFRSFGNNLTFKNFIAEIPMAMKIFIGLNILFYFAQLIAKAAFSFNLLKYIAFTPILIFEKYYVWQFITAPVVSTNLVNLVALVLFMVFFGMPYNRRYGDRLFTNVIILQSLFVCVAYFVAFLVVHLVMNNPMTLSKFNPLDVTHSLRMALIVLWGYEFWSMTIVPPVQVKHAVILFLFLDVYFAFQSLSVGWISPWFELMVIPFAYFMAKYNLAAKLDFIKWWNGMNGPKPPKDGGEQKRPSYLKVVK